LQLASARFVSIVTLALPTSFYIPHRKPSSNLAQLQRGSLALELIRRNIATSQPGFAIAGISCYIARAFPQFSMLAHFILPVHSSNQR
jgi:hypothetical protein